MSAVKKSGGGSLASPKRQAARFAASSSSSIRTTAAGVKRKQRGKPGVSLSSSSVLSKEQTQDLIDAFELFDSTGNGRINFKELRAAMKAVGYEASKQDMNEIRIELTGYGSSSGMASMSAGSPSKKRRSSMFPTVTLQDFIGIMSKNNRMPNLNTRESSDKIFELFDPQGCGYIDFTSLKRACFDLSMDLKDSEIELMISEADRSLNRTGQITKDDFWHIWKKRSDDPLDQISSDEEDEQDHPNHAQSTTKTSSMIESDIKINDDSLFG